MLSFKFIASNKKQQDSLLGGYDHICMRSTNVTNSDKQRRAKFTIVNEAKRTLLSTVPTGALIFEVWRSRFSIDHCKSKIDTATHPQDADIPSKL